MADPDRTLRVVNVMDPLMCLRCSNAHIAEVLFSDGTTRRMFYCSRLDCDNWVFTEKKITEQEELESKPVQEVRKTTGKVDWQEINDKVKKIIG